MKKKLTFEQFKKEVEIQLKKQYGLDMNDTSWDDEKLKELHKESDDVQELLDNNATKYDLDRIDQNGYF